MCLSDTYDTKPLETSREYPVMLQARVAFPGLAGDTCRLPVAYQDRRKRLLNTTGFLLAKELSGG